MAWFASARGMRHAIVQMPAHVRCSLLPIARRATLTHAGCSENLPPELQDLRLTQEGLLIDEKTGEVINEYGANRFDVAVRAMRGDFDPPPTVENTERSSGVLLDSLVQWPAVYDFQFVLKSNGDAPETLLEELREMVAKICQWEVALDACTVKERKGGKFVSLCIPATVRYPELIQKVFQAVEGDDRILMKY